MKQFSRDEMMKFISKYKHKVRTTDEFFGYEEENEYSGGIWIGGEFSEKDKKFRGKDIYKYYTYDPSYNRGILKSWEEYLNSKGWASEWYDGGTILIWKREK